MKIKPYSNLDKKLAILGLIFSVIVIIYSIIKGTYLYTITGILVFFSFFYWFCIRNKDLDISIKNFENRKLTKTFSSIFFLILSLTLIILYERPELYTRPLIYFVLVSFLATIIGLEILFYEKNQKYLILIQIITLGILLSFSQILIFPAVVGVDPWWHQMFTEKIINLGYIPPNYLYSNLPIFHLEAAIISIITGLSYKIAFICSITFLQILIDSLFIFIIGKQLFNEKVGLLAALIVIISNLHISLGFAAIPTTLGPPLLLIIIYLFFKKKDMINIMLAILIMIIVILNHSVTALIISMILLIAYLVHQFYYKAYSDENKFNKSNFTLNISLLFFVMMFGWWIYASGHITNLVRMFDWGLSLDLALQQPEITKAVIQSIPISEKIFANIGMFTFFALSVIGSLFMINKKYGNLERFTIAFIGLILLSIGFISILLGKFIIVERWLYFTEVILAIPISISIILLIKTKRKFITASILTSVILFISFISIMSPAANIDNHYFVPNSDFTTSLSQSELTAINTTGNIWKGRLASDTYYSSTVIQFLGYKYSVTDGEIYYKDFHNQTKNLVLVRERMYNEPIKLYGSAYKIDYNLNDLISNKEGFSEIYDVGSVQGYLKLSE